MQDYDRDDEEDRTDDMPDSLLPAKREPERAEPITCADLTRSKDSVGSYIIPQEATVVTEVSSAAEVMRADVQIANGVLRAIAAGWDQVATIGDIGRMAKLTLFTVGERRKLLNQQHGSSNTSGKSSIFDPIS
jgi:hypothetical protein